MSGIPEQIWMVAAIVGGVAAGLLALRYPGGGAGGQRQVKRPSRIGLTVLGLGLVSVVLVFLDWTYPGLGVGLAALVAGVGALIRGDRDWAVWTGVIAAAPMTLLVLFVSLLFLVGLGNS